MKILMVSNPSSPLTYRQEGSPQGGGRNAFVQIHKLLSPDHHVDAITPIGSDIPDMNIIPISGNTFNINHYQTYDMEPTDFYPITHDSCLSNMYEFVVKHDSEYDVIVNFAQDWLPYYLMPFLKTPVFNRMNHVPVSQATLHISRQRCMEFPQHFAGVSKSQIKECGMDENFVFPLLQGIDIDDYRFWPKGDDGLAMIARVDPSKGIIDAAEIAFRTGHKLYVYGSVTDQDYAQTLLARYPETVEMMGYVSSNEIKRTLGRHRGLLMTHKWLEAMALGGIEAMAVGLPIITYDRGGPPELVENGRNGFIVAADHIDAAAISVDHLNEIDRTECRSIAQIRYGIPAFRERLFSWLKTNMPGR